MTERLATPGFAGPSASGPWFCAGRGGLWGSTCGTQLGRETRAASVTSVSTVCGSCSCRAYSCGGEEEEEAAEQVDRADSGENAAAEKAEHPAGLPEHVETGERAPSELFGDAGLDEAGEGDVAGGGGKPVDQQCGGCQRQRGDGSEDEVDKTADGVGSGPSVENA